MFHPVLELWDWQGYYFHIFVGNQTITPWDL